MEKRLENHGMTTVAQLCAASPLALRQAWGGIEGQNLYRKLRGEWMPHAHSNGRGSISHSHVLAPAMRNLNGAEAVLKKLLQKAAMRLRSEKLVAGRLEVKVKHLDHASWKETVFCNDTDDSHTLLMQLSEMLAHRPAGGRPLVVAVTLSDLCQRIGTTDDLFTTAKTKEHAPLSALMDRINDRFGPQKISYASSQTAAKEAPMRIAFRRIPDIAHEDESFSRK
jgi:DNA polymerase-4